MKVLNVRVGFANNSSSSHSILLCNREDHNIVDFNTERELNDLSYGWEMFICASPEAKTRYFAYMLASVLRPQLGVQITSLVLKALFNVPEEYGRGDIDHNSILHLPINFEGEIELKFLKEIFDAAINNPQVVIQGGNDNSDIERPLDCQEDPLFQYFTTSYNSRGIRIRKEPYGWCLFNLRTGAKLRLGQKDATTNLPETPEFVDLCITHFCDKGCKFCYQNSTKRGEHADIKYLNKLQQDLQDLQVFEVVLGGGEPTKHPFFSNILETFKEYHNIVPNFTTFNTDWLEDKVIVEAVIKYAGSVAFSCHNLQQLQEIITKISKTSYKLREKIVLQSIVGLVSPDELQEMIKRISKEPFMSKYSLVGYKPTGRAYLEPPYPIKSYNLKQLVLSFPNILFYADTALLNLCPDIVEEYTCDTREGAHSMYIDAVDMTVRESSYTGEPVELRPSLSHTEQIQKAFTSFQKRKE